MFANFFLHNSITFLIVVLIDHSAYFLITLLTINPHYTHLYNCKTVEIVFVLL